MLGLQVDIAANVGIVGFFRFSFLLRLYLNLFGDLFLVLRRLFQGRRRRWIENIHGLGLGIDGIHAAHPLVNGETIMIGLCSRIGALSPIF